MTARPFGDLVDGARTGYYARGGPRTADHISRGICLEELAVRCVESIQGILDLYITRDCKCVGRWRWADRPYVFEISSMDTTKQKCENEQD